jgi:FkbM family methyltransferase
VDECMLKEMVQSLVHLTGYEIMSRGRAQLAFGHRRCVAAILKEQDINMVLDVGANVGQFGQWIRQIGYHGHIVSFEPVADAHRKLSQVAKQDSQWTIVPRMALGFRSGQIQIHVARNSYSSSVLPMLASHMKAAPESGYIDCETAPVNRLDDVYLPLQNERILLKIDVQGYEKAVLDGASTALRNCRAIIVEMSLVPLYEGQSLAIDLWDYLIRLGFQACDFNPEFRDPQSGRILQMDGVFTRG